MLPGSAVRTRRTPCYYAHRGKIIAFVFLLGLIVVAVALGARLFGGESFVRSCEPSTSPSLSSCPKCTCPPPPLPSECDCRPGSDVVPSGAQDTTVRVSPSVGDSLPDWPSAGASSFASSATTIIDLEVDVVEFLRRRLVTTSGVDPEIGMRSVLTRADRAFIARKRWSLMKKRHEKHCPKPTTTLMTADLFYNGLSPVVSCEYLARIGPPGDGGKYICNHHMIFGRRNPDGSVRQCRAYDVGIGVYTTYGLELRKFGCDVWFFDVFHKFKDPQFRYYGLGPGRYGNWTVKDRNKEDVPLYPLSHFSEDLNHDYVDILKFDIEGAEINFAENLVRDPRELQNFKSLNVKVMNFEFHAYKTHCQFKNSLVELLDSFAKLGYFMYAMEANFQWPSGAEVSLVHWSAI